MREECYACSPPEADGFVKPATAGTPGKPLTTDLRGLAALMTDRSEPTGRAEPTTEVATSASIGDAELDKRLEPSLVAVVARSGLTSHDYTAAVCARQ